MRIKNAEEMRFRTSKTGLEMKYYEDIVERITHCLSSVWKDPTENCSSVLVSCHYSAELTDEQARDILSDISHELGLLDYQVSVGTDFYGRPGPMEVSWK